MGLRKNLRSNLLLMWEVFEAAAHNSLLTRTLPPAQVSKGAKDFGKSVKCRLQLVAPDGDAQVALRGVVGQASG